eukprot:CAMPEP_0173390504 /NCGR_PEP_ID=MMETSP1356-20130122/15106_1 /TAXON_ID=77927 ORGANISM="Hemiselmis virescens, Strain PCC157" /NCGR_SAMPLE_ID=MMETSP1356 /ASSEMBLY_ACC=CAM_ASM_000847 /LENGTH=593 /DNA_ID=CAMNT_0014347915 /DNA_START=29 /DNA_END=1810 /DNA_ORIENTATION=+
MDEHARAPTSGEAQLEAAKPAMSGESSLSFRRKHCVRGDVLSVALTEQENPSNSESSSHSLFEGSSPMVAGGSADADTPSGSMNRKKWMQERFRSSDSDGGFGRMHSTPIDLDDDDTDSPWRDRRFIARPSVDGPLRQEFDKFDKTNTGTLNKRQLGNLLFARLYRQRKEAARASKEKDIRCNNSQAFNLSTKAYTTDNNTTYLVASNAMDTLGIVEMDFETFFAWHNAYGKAIGKPASLPPKDCLRDGASPLTGSAIFGSGRTPSARRRRGSADSGTNASLAVTPRSSGGSLESPTGRSPTGKTFSRRRFSMDSDLAMASPLASTPREGKSGSFRRFSCGDSAGTQRVASLQVGTLQQVAARTLLKNPTATALDPSSPPAEGAEHSSLPMPIHEPFPEDQSTSHRRGRRLSLSSRRGQNPSPRRARSSARREAGRTSSSLAQHASGMASASSSFSARRCSSSARGSGGCQVASASRSPSPEGASRRVSVSEGVSPVSMASPTAEEDTARTASTARRHSHSGEGVWGSQDEESQKGGRRASEPVQYAPSSGSAVSSKSGGSKAAPVKAFFCRLAASLPRVFSFFSAAPTERVR